MRRRRVRLLLTLAHCYILTTTADDDKVFLIGEELEFRTGSVEGAPTLIWRDLDGDVDESYEFVASGTNKATIDFFVQSMYKAMFERKYRTGSDNVSDRDLKEFLWQCVLLRLPADFGVLIILQGPWQENDGKRNCAASIKVSIPG